jgi:alpha-amylase/alpha-mannosidase (GH57 family)
MQQYIRTTMAFSPAFHLKLKLIAEESGKPMSQLIEDTLAPILEKQEKVRLERMYEGLQALSGMCKDPITDASITIDEVLYGDSWKGEA